MKNANKPPLTPEQMALQKAMREEEWKRRRNQLRTAQKPIIEDLSHIGIGVDSVWDLNIEYDDYDNAIEILLKHIVLDYPDIIKEGIARALSVPAARSSFGFLVKLFESTDPSDHPQFKEGLASAIAKLASDVEIDKIVELITDVRHGDVRLHLLLPLMRSKLDRAHDLLERLSSDPTFAKEIKARRRPRK
ncbi:MULTISPECIES: hypothetical protein [unclassified Inquilinus]|uniref:hypothetical protein n=1 Tax=unclassified Inquilinus TaxID=2645927 RepID=UPI003F8F9475